VLFMQGGAIGENAIVPMNMLRGRTSADYVNTGQWSKKSIKEAGKYARVHVAASSEASKFTEVPPFETWELDPNAAYVHICANETIGGVEYHWTPDTGDVPLVADVSSNILSRPLDVARYGLLYGGAQKNIGPAGLTIVIVREDLIGKARPGTPAVLDYKAMADDASMLNTPPTLAWYLSGLVLKWIQAQGGLKAMEQRNRAKAEALYSAIDASGFYRNPVARECRSWMNVPFTLARPELDKTFIAEAQAAGLTNLEGHRSVGGMRASIYNAMPLAGVQALIGFMQEFQRRNG
jgi:phosphoserine aminotransferase